ncbi:MAG: hypothetical protein KKE98_07540 [Nanoarchaeota archaeon]|nr:hypothetical protein [Nanoarchaeota archaeon]
MKEKLKPNDKKKDKNTDKALEELAEPQESKPDPMKFIADQVLSLFRENYVDNPDDVTYQFSRKIAKEVFAGKYNSDNELVNEGVAIGVYRGVTHLLKKFITK